MKISIVTVNWWAKDFANLLIRKAVELAHDPDDLEIVIVDNSGELKPEDLPHLPFNTEVRILKPKYNLRHGMGLDYGIADARGEYILVLDIDCHILMQDWDLSLRGWFLLHCAKLACAMDGELLKPAKPLAMFFAKSTFNGRISFAAIELNGVKFDVGVHAYFRVLSEYGNDSVLPLPYAKTKYAGVLGSEYLLNGERFCYHEWYGTRFYGPNGRVERDVIDGLTYNQHIESKINLLKQA